MTHRAGAAKPQGWPIGPRRTPLVAGGFLMGAVIGALPPMQDVAARVNCTMAGGEWIVVARACELRAMHPYGISPDAPAREHNLLYEEPR